MVLAVFLPVAFLGGVLTALSPCILPVIPFVLTPPSGSRRGLAALLAGMVLSFAGLAAFGTLASQAVIGAGRIAALALLAVFGASLLVPRLAAGLAAPFVALGARLQLAARDPGPALGGFLVGVATGLLWTPCAGPILGLILSGAMLGGADAASFALLVAYAAGAAGALATIRAAGRRLVRNPGSWTGASEGLRRAGGALVLASVLAIAAGYDQLPLTRLPDMGLASVEQAVIDRVGALGTARAAETASDGNDAVPPLLRGATGWLNGGPLRAGDLRGKVVLVNFWTYSCINCLRTLPQVRALAETYGPAGLVVVGIHTPEFAFEHDRDRVAAALGRLGVPWPVALDNDYAIWRAFSNRYWPAQYLLDADGQIRHEQFGEGRPDGIERAIRQLLSESGARLPEAGVARNTASGTQAPSDPHRVASPETYLGYAQANAFAGAALVPDRDTAYTLPARLALNGWALDGTWRAGPDSVAIRQAGGRLAMRFQARDLHLVLGPGAAGPVRFRVRLDGAEPGRDGGTDLAPDGTGTVTEHRLYQLVRQSDPSRARTFEIEFLDPGAMAYAVTFG